MELIGHGRAVSRLAGHGPVAFPKTGVQKGDILVTNMTTPDLVPTMRTVAGIITTQGGILCHAAIVSRELGVPCIVGATLLTTVLRGDLLHMDASGDIWRMSPVPTV